MSNTFRLASVLRVARLRKRIAKADAAVAATTAESAAADAEDAAARAEPSPLPSVPAAELVANQQLAELRAAAAELAADAQRRAEVRLQAARDHWHRQHREVRTLERLEDRDATHKAELATRASQKTLDDLAMLRRRTLR